MDFKLCFALTYFIVALAVSFAEAKECETSPQQADHCMKKLVFEGDRNRYVPRNEEQLDEHCKGMEENLKCLDKHAKCYKPFPRQLFTLGIRHGKKIYKDRCKSKKGRLEFLKHMDCIVSEERSEPSHKCVDRLTVMVNHILKNVDSKEHFPSACCAFHIFERCLLTEVEKACASTTGRETAQYVFKTISAIVADFLDLACNKYRSIDECRTNFPEGMKELQESAIDAPPQNGSALFPFLQIAIKFNYR